MQITDPLLTKKEAAAILNISVPTLYRRVADGTIPRPLKIGALSKWALSDILGTIEDAKAARNLGA
ncbi:excisionase family DNA binding protein [Rhizobium sp. BK049]|uniref:helix-turn-helix transcriptional regulator n=1 Tax=Rhizobium sp. BK049 TaxID=2587095 RepID=UPI00161C16A5|nr:helix-turn-helix domain-containing protein [Rhizobium sp. BK049]MBB3355322.1 excisionase family DNA binding protein [Rhizobium sp. BK049]